MKDTNLRSVTGLLMTLSQIALLLSAIALFLIDALLFDQLTTIVAITAPVFGMYATAYIGHVVLESKAKGKVQTQVSGEYAVLTIALCLAFAAIALGLIWLKGLALVPMSFEQFKGLFGLTEVIVGSLASRLYFAQYGAPAA